MAKRDPSVFLNEKDYKNYRNVRAVSVLYIILGTILLFAGVIVATIEPQNGQTNPPIWTIPFCLIVGLSGVVGGIATLAARRKWAKFTYIIAGIYIFGFPVGTILSIVIFAGLGRYLDSAESLRNPPQP